ncbi:hypothetical protein L5515_011777 [Caenorhabditis briggsae]|nr:hypothetical protein L5515_011777 [Caenorhabditis briggsae]
MGDTATSRYKYYDSIELPAVYQDIEYYDDKPFIEVKKLENDPVFVDECYQSIQSILVVFASKLHSTRIFMRSLILLSVVLLITGRVKAANEFEMAFEAQPDCDAAEGAKGGKTGTKVWAGNSKYRIVEAYIYWTNSNGKILGMAACNVPASSNCVKNHASPKGAARQYLAIAVTLVKTSFEDQNIHYQYFDELFGLSKLSHPSIHDGKSQPLHNLNNFIYVKSASYNNKAGPLQFTAKSCRSDRAKSLISGHGYFITEFGLGGVWENLYYLPDRIGQYITTPN